MSVQLLQIFIEVTGNKELCTSGTFSNCSYDALQGGGIVRQEVADHHVPSSLAGHQLEDDNVRAVFLLGFH